MQKLNVAANRRATKWTFREKLGRVAWHMVWPLFRLSPRPLWGLRRVLLRIFGASIGDEVRIHPTVKITIPWNLQVGDESSLGDSVIVYALGRIVIGARSTISQYAHLCAGSHDISDPKRTLVKATIHIGDDVWVAADAFIGPDVCVCNGSIVGARAVVMRNVPPGKLVVGNPAVQV